MTSKNIQIVSVQLTDIENLLKIGKATFAETFVDDCTPADMEKFLEEQHNYNLIESELKNAESRFFFAVIDNEIAAYLKVNTGNALTETKLENSFEVERIYVLAQYQGQSVGKMLMEYAINLAKTENYSCVWLGVWEHNTKAIRFYEKNGFEIFDSHPFVVGTDHQTDVLMKLKL